MEIFVYRKYSDHPALLTKASFPTPLLLFSSQAFVGKKTRAKNIHN
jgi:hypothetical protein